MQSIEKEPAIRKLVVTCSDLEESPTLKMKTIQYQNTITQVLRQR